MAWGQGNVCWAVPAAVAVAAVVRLGHAVMRSLYAPASVVQPLSLAFWYST